MKKHTNNAHESMMWLNLEELREAAQQRNRERARKIGAYIALAIVAFLVGMFIGSFA